MMGVHGTTIADKRSTVGSDVVLVRSELATLGGDTLQLLLGWGVGVTDVHEKTLFTNSGAMKLLDHLVTNVSVLETTVMLAYEMAGYNVCIPSKTNATTVAHTIPKDFAGQDGEASKNDTKLLVGVSDPLANQSMMEKLTTSVKDLGRLEM